MIGPVKLCAPCVIDRKEIEAEAIAEAEGGQP